MIGFDTLAAAGLIDEQRPMNLKDLAGVALGVDNWGKGSQAFGYKEGPPEEILARNAARPTKAHLGDLWGDEGMGPYCARDVAYTHMLYESQKPQLREEQGLSKLLKYLTLPGLEAFGEIEKNGIYLDWEYAAESENILSIRADEAEQELLEAIDSDLLDEWYEKGLTTKEKKAGATIPVKPVLGNEHFLRALLFTDERGLLLNPISFTPARHEPRVDEGSLKELDHDIPRSLIELRQARKNLSFFDQWREWRCDCGRVHPYFNVLKGGGGDGDDDRGGTVSGRRSCDRPNMQQVPKFALMRGCVSAQPGWLFLEVDYSQLEVRIMAWLSGDETLLAIYNDPDGDVYRHFASVANDIPESEVTKEQRNKAKPIVLGLLYGMGWRTLQKYAASQYGVHFTEAEAETQHRLFFSTYIGVARFHLQQKRLVNANLQVESPTGRIRHLMDILSYDKFIRGKAERQAINSPDQGTGGDMNLASIIELMGFTEFYEGLDPAEVRVVGDVHDAIHFELRLDTWRANAKKILEVMEHPRVLIEKLVGAPFPLPMVAEGTVGARWGQGQGFTLNGSAKIMALADIEIDPRWGEHRFDEELGYYKLPEEAA